ncbi:hypothetical protein DVK02_07735 [Halobellus sp. Atlit-31R]|nr:hypothetical protein DVK02_07735 [Halobellus sp. Atlit-31R]
MSRRVPEFAVVTGVFLGISALVSGILLGWGLYATVVVGAVVAYPFVGFGIVRDDDPAATIKPQWLLAGGGVVAAAGALGVLLDNPTPRGVLVSVLVAAALGAPAAGYATRYGAGVNPLPPRTTVFVGAVAGAALLAAGVAVGTPFVGAGAGVAAGLGAALYGTARGVTFDRRTKQVAAAGGGVLGIAIVAVGVVRGGPLGEWLLVGTATALVPSLYTALTAESGGRSRRSQW